MIEQCSDCSQSMAMFALIKYSFKQDSNETKVCNKVDNVPLCRDHFIMCYYEQQHSHIGTAQYSNINIIIIIIIIVTIV